MPSALITGAGGQDGWYMADLLSRKGYEVHGLVRRTSSRRELHKAIREVQGDVTDGESVGAIVREIKPDEVYHFAAMSHVGHSFRVPQHTFDVNVQGTINVLEAVRKHGGRLYQASTSEMFGRTPGPLNEASRFDPQSPYAASKIAAHHMCALYRECYGVWVACGIAFNHESERRGPDFVTSRIAAQVAEMRNNERERLSLGNLEARRDWGHAADYVEAMWRMLQQSEPMDLVLATGQSISVRDLAQEFCHVGMVPWKEPEQDARQLRPSDVMDLRADPSRARARLFWQPRTTLRELAREMVGAAFLGRNMVRKIA